MKDFADLDNSSGSFPDVVGVDCSGPGETDGTELTADYFNQHFGWIQALLNDQGVTPDGNDESDSSGSQILNAIKTLIIPTVIPVSDLCVAGSAGNNWFYDTSAGGLKSLINSGSAVCGIPVVYGLGQTIDLTILVTPGAARTGTNRMTAQLSYITDSGTGLTSINTAYDDGTTGLQNISLSSGAFTPVAGRTYFLIMLGGNTAASAQDYIYSIKQSITLS